MRIGFPLLLAVALAGCHMDDGAPRTPSSTPGGGSDVGDVDGAGGKAGGAGGGGIGGGGTGGGGGGSGGGGHVDGGASADMTPSPDPPPTPNGGDMGLPPAGDDHGDGGDPGQLGDGGVFTPPPVDQGPVQHAPPATFGSDVTIFGSGTDFRDVSSDQGGGTWAITASTVYYWPTRGGAAFTYDQRSGLARGQQTFHDIYWCAGFGMPCPQDFNVEFMAIAGGQSGQAVIGEQGTIGDRLEVDPATGEVRSIVNAAVTSTQQSDPAELEAQQQREVTSLQVAVDLNGTFSGTAYLGGWHGLSALHGLMLSRTSGSCGLGCGDFEEHVHPFMNGGTVPGGRDVHAITITPEGDLWVGDDDAVWFLPQRSVGPFTDFFTPQPQIPGQTASYLDVFPGKTDWVYSIDVDAAGGVWVASWGNGLAYLAPGTYAPTYYSTADVLPQNQVSGVAVDALGDVWVGTRQQGVARFTPSTQTWSYYTEISGLPSSWVRAVHADKNGSGRAVYFATAGGVALYTGN